MTSEVAFIDFDGVLVDSEPKHFISYQTVLKTYGIDISSEQFSTQYMGQSEPDIVSKISNDYSCSIDYQSFSEKRNTVVFDFVDNGDMRPFQPVISFINENLRNHQKFILSSQSRNLIESCLQQDGFPDFDTIYSAPELGVNKKEIALELIKEGDYLIEDNIDFLFFCSKITKNLVYVRHSLNGPGKPEWQTINGRQFNANI